MKTFCDWLLRQKYFGFWALIVGSIILSFLYLIEWRERSGAQYSGFSYSVDDGGIYLVKYYYMRNGYAFLRLYRSRDGKLLAERTFRYPDRIQLLWLERELVYSTNDYSWFYDGRLPLPPSRLDQLFAQIP